MCDPATLGMMAASAALSAGGAAVSSHEANKNAEREAGARNSVLAASLKRQRGYGDEARTYFDNRMKDYEKPAQAASLEKAQTDRTTGITGNISTPSANDIPLSGSAPAVVKGEIAKRMLTAFNDATSRAKALGKVGGYGDNWLGNNTGVADTARRVGTINNFSQNDAALLPAEQDLAQIGARRTPSIWGPVLSAGGNILAAGAGSGWSPFGAAPAPNALPGSAALHRLY